MFAWQREIYPSTVVDHALKCNVTQTVQTELALVSSNRIQIFRIIQDETKTDTDEKSPEATETENTKSDKMNVEFVLDWKSSGPISSIQKVRFMGESRDFLIVAFPTAKIVIIGYDPANHKMVTKSMHYFESEENDIKEHVIWSTSTPGYDPLVRVDPENRCAASLVYGYKLVILPFRRIVTGAQTLRSIGFGAELSFHNENQDRVTQAEQILASYSINLKAFTGVNVARVIDIEFLEGYNNPTLIVLYEKELTWSGRVGARTDTCACLVLSINSAERMHPIVWQSESLPYDCFRLKPVPKPIGGCLVFGSTTLTWLDQSAPSTSVCVNSIIPKKTNVRSFQQHNLQLSLDNSVAEFVDGNRFLLSLKGGELYHVRLMHEKEYPGIRDFTFISSKVMASSPSTIAVLGKNLIFYGSRLGNSFIIRSKKIGEKNETTKTTESQKPIQSMFNDETMDETSESKSKDILSVYNNPKEENHVDPEERMLYGNSENQDEELKKYLAKQTTEDEEKITWEILDEFINIGPCAKADLSEHKRQKYFDDDRNVQLQSVMATGHGDAGSIVSVRQFVTPHVVTTQQLPHVNGLWTLVKNDEGQNCENGEKGENGKNGENCENVDANVSESKKSGILKEHDLIIVGQQEERYISRGQKQMADISLVLETGGREIKEAMTSGFEVNDCTISAGNIGGKSIFYQVTRQGTIVLLSGTTKIYKHSIKQEVLDAVSVNNLLCLQLNDGKILIFKLIQSERQGPEDGEVNDDEEIETEAQKTGIIASLIKIENPIVSDLKKVSSVSFLNQGKKASGMNVVNMTDMQTERTFKNNIRDQIAKQFKETHQIDIDEMDVTQDTTVDPIEEEETWLYGESEAPFLELKKKFESGLLKIRGDIKVSEVSFLFLIREEHSLQIFALQEKTDDKIVCTVDLVFEMANVSLGHRLLYDHQVVVGSELQTGFQEDGEIETDSKNPETPDETGTEAELSMETDENPSTNTLPKQTERRTNTIREICVNQPNNCSRVFMFLRIRQEDPDPNQEPLDEIIVYESFKYHTVLTGKTNRNTVDCCFKRVDVDKQLILTNPDRDASDEITSLVFGRKKTIFPFEYIDGYNGVMLTDLKRPMVGIVSDHQRFTFHPVREPDGILTMCAFNNVNCHHGMVYYTFSGHLRVASLDREVIKGDTESKDIRAIFDRADRWRLDQGTMPMRQVKIGVTPDFILYHPEQQVYTVVTHTMQDLTYLPRVDQHGDHCDLHPKREENFVWDQTEKFEACLYDHNFRKIKVDGTVPTLPIGDYEHVTCLELVALRRKGRGTQRYVALGVAHNMGEDVTSKGKLTLAEVKDNKTYNIIYSDWQRGSFTAVGAIRGCLISAVGQKLYIHKMNDSDDGELLQPLAFLDIGTYMYDLKCFKSYALVTDLYKGVFLVRFQEIQNANCLSVVAREKRTGQDAMAADLLVSREQIGFIKFDTDFNVNVYGYEAKLPLRNTAGAMSLTKYADTRLVTPVNTTWRVKTKCGALDSYYKRQVTYYAGQNGSLGLIVPIEELVYRRLSMLQNFLVTQFWQNGGLNPKSFRQSFVDDRYLHNVEKNILDGDLLCKFYNLSVYERQQLTRHMGTSVAQVLNDLEEIQRANLLI